MCCTLLRTRNPKTFGLIYRAICNILTNRLISVFSAVPEDWPPRPDGHCDPWNGLRVTDSLLPGRIESAASVRHCVELIATTSPSKHCVCNTVGSIDIYHKSGKDKTSGTHTHAWLSLYLSGSVYSHRRTQTDNASSEVANEWDKNRRTRSSSYLFKLLSFLLVLARCTNEKVVNDPSRNRTSAAHTPSQRQPPCELSSRAEVRIHGGSQCLNNVFICPVSWRASTIGDPVSIFAPVADSVENGLTF